MLKSDSGAARDVFIQTVITTSIPVKKCILKITLVIGQISSPVDPENRRLIEMIDKK